MGVPRLRPALPAADGAGAHHDFELARKHREHHVDPTVVQLMFVPVGSLWRVLAVGAVLLLVVMPSTGTALTAMAAAAALLLGYE